MIRKDSFAQLLVNYAYVGKFFNREYFFLSGWRGGLTQFLNGAIIRGKWKACQWLKVDEDNLSHRLKGFFILVYSSASTPNSLPICHHAVCRWRVVLRGLFVSFSLWVVSFLYHLLPSYRMVPLFLAVAVAHIPRPYRNHLWDFT